MNCILNIAGKSSNDIYQLEVPNNLLGFCKFDFTRFMDESNQLCRECMKSGEYPIDEINIIKNSITTCHRYYENNMRGLFDKIVVDCWIEYICRQGEIGTSTLWNSFADCKNPFQKVIFQRLSEYRAHRAINQWVNLLKMQEYAQKKIEYVFGVRLNGVREAVARLNFFDLMFSVAANEQGYSLDTVSSIKVCRPGRLSTAPFVYSGAAKEIIRNLFKSVRFAESQPYVSREEGVMSDWEAMDAFSMIKSYLPDNSDSVVNTIMKTIVKLPETVYMPSGFKAVIDLEIDTVLNNNAFLQRCRRCNEYYVRDDSYTSDYCSNPRRDGTTCRGIMEQPKFDPPTPEELDALKEKADNLYKEVSERVGKDIQQKDFIEWLGNFNVIKNKVVNGEARSSDFDDFIVYTNQFSFPPEPEASEPEITDGAETKEEEQKEEEKVEISADGKKIKPYQFTKIDRKELEQSGLLKPLEKQDDAPVPTVKEPAVVAPPPPQVAKIIRGGTAAVYRDLPARPISNGDSKPQAERQIPIKSDVYLGEDFSLGGNSDITKFSSFVTAGKAASAEKNEPVKKPSENNHFLPDLDQFTDFSDIEENTDIRKAKTPKVKLPDFGRASEDVPTDSDGFKDLFADSENRRHEDKNDWELPKSISDSVSELISAPSFDHISGSVPERTSNHISYPTSDLASDNVSRSAPEHGRNSILKTLSDFRASEESKQSEISPNRDTAVREWNPERLTEENRDGGGVQTGASESKEETRQERGSAYSRYSANSAYGGSRVNPVRSDNGDMLRERGADEDGFRNDINPIAEKPVLTGERPARPENSSRAARVVNAYKTVSHLDMETGSGEEKKTSGRSDDFARILDSIERNDGFEEEELPLDNDGVPLSHKTKHVMDALMKNTGVSPSLIYGRRQAAEKNVVLDESFGEKKK